MSAQLPNGTVGGSYYLPFPSRRTRPAELRVASKTILEIICDPIIVATILWMDLICIGFKSSKRDQGRFELKI